MNGLDLYAKIEYLFEFDEVVEYLWDRYLQELQKLNIKTILDIGCGSGGFMLKAKELGFEVVGIDISKEMINNAKKHNLEVYHTDLCEFHGKFDACVAIFDVINYMDKEYLKNFFRCVKNVLKKDGYFLFDVNSYFAFDEIAQGTLAVEDENIFGVLDSVFDGKKMDTEVVVFENQNNCYKKQKGKITQFYHNQDELKSLSNMEFIKKLDIKLYSDEADKELWILKN